MSNVNLHSKHLQMRQANHQSTSSKRRSDRLNEAGKETPKTTRVGGTLNHANSQQKVGNLDKSRSEDLESGGSIEKVQESNAETTFNVDEIKRTLSNIGEDFVKWIIEGVQAVQRETVLDASRQIQNIKSLLNLRKSISEKSKSARQRKSMELITPLLDSADYLMMVIDNYIQKMMQKEQEGNGYDLSFADMFQDDIEESQNTFFIKQDSSTVKSILKTSNVDNNITRKKISFSEKATKVYQDNETSQISLAKSSSSAKSSERNVDAISTSGKNLDFNNPTSSETETTKFFRTLVDVPNPKLQTQEVGQITPTAYETPFIDGSPSIIESSFLIDSFPNGLVNSTKNFKKFKHKTENKNEIQNSRSVNKGNQLKEDDTSDNFQAEPMDTELKNTYHQNTNDVLMSSNLFSDELVQTFMSQITGKDGEQNVSKTSENGPLPFQDFVLTLPGSTSSEESLDAKVRMAMNISNGSIQNVEVPNPGNREKNAKTENETEWVWRPENSTEIIPSSEQFGEDAFGWPQTPWENVTYNFNASDNSSINISLLFDQACEASRIPGTFIHQNHSNLYCDAAKVVTDGIPMEQGQGPTEHKTIESDAIKLSGGLRIPYQKQDSLFCETHDDKHARENLDDGGELYNTPKAIKVPCPSAGAKQQGTEKEHVPKTFTNLENAIHASNKSQESGHEVVPSPNSALEGIDMLSGDGLSALGNLAENYQNVTERSNKESSNPGVAKKYKNLLIEPSSSSGYAFDNQRPTIFSSGDFDKTHGEKTLMKSLSDTTNSREPSSEQKLLRDPNKHMLKELPLKPPTPNKIVNTNQQSINLFGNSYKEHLEKELLKIRANSLYSPIQNTCDSKSQYTRVASVAKEPLLQQPTQDVQEKLKLEVESKKLDSETIVDQVRDGMTNIRNRFQETLLTGHWLKSGLQRNTTSSLFPSLEPFSNSEVNKQGNDINENNSLKAGGFDEMRRNLGTGMKLNIETDEVESRNFHEQNIQCVRNTNVYQLTEISQPINSIHGNVMEHSTLNEQQRALWKPKTSTFSHLTLSDTEPVREKTLNTQHTVQTERSNINGTTINRPFSKDLKNLEDSGRDPSIIHKENTGTNFGVIPEQNKFATVNVDNRNNNLSSTLFDENLLKPFQPYTFSAFPLHTSLHNTDSGKFTSNVNQSSILIDKEEGRYGSGRSRVTSKEVASNSQNRGDEGLESYNNNYYQTEVNQQGTNLTAGNINDEPSSTQHTLITSFAPQNVPEITVPLKTSSTENSKWQNNNTQNTKTTNNSLKKSVTKPQRGRPKKACKPKLNTSTVKNKLILDTLTSEGPLSEDFQKCTSTYSKITRKKSQGTRAKASGHIGDGNSGEALNEEITTDNAQKVSSLTNKAQSCNIRKRAPPKGKKASRDCPPNLTNMRDTSREELQQPFGVKHVTKKRKDETLLSSSVTNHSGEKKAYLEDNNSSAIDWADSIEDNNYDCSNPNVSKDREDAMYKYQLRDATITKGYCDENSRSADQEQDFEQMDMRFEECNNLSWDELLDCINSLGSPSNRDSRSNEYEEELGQGNTHPNTFHGNPAGYLSLTQLSWGQSATSGISPISTKSNTEKQEMETKLGSFLQPAESANTPNEETHAQYAKRAKTNAEIPIDYQSLIQLSWGQSATCGVPPTTKNEAAGSGLSTSTTQPGKRTEFELPFTPQLLAVANQQLSFNNFMKDISSTEKVLGSAPLPLNTTKTEEEEIEEILNGIEFVRVPTESEFIEASSIEELINDQSFMW